jgi:hypothetical protein
MLNSLAVADASKLPNTITPSQATPIANISNERICRILVLCGCEAPYLPYPQQAAWSAADDATRARGEPCCYSSTDALAFVDVSFSSSRNAMTISGTLMEARETFAVATSAPPRSAAGGFVSESVNQSAGEYRASDDEREFDENLRRIAKPKPDEPEHCPKKP